MTIAKSLLPEFDQETRTTRSLLERVPEAKASWKPHPKSTSLGDLAAHVTNLVNWGSYTLTTDELDFASPAAAKVRLVNAFTTTAALLEAFDQVVARTRAAIEQASDEDVAKPWTLRNGDQTIFTLPRTACLRFFIMNHGIHHRGQLSVYLRLLDVPLPSIYGPTADM